MVLFPISLLINMKSLDLNKCEKLTDEGLSFISSFINLTDLNLELC